jgi:hypothetical protein
LRYINDNDPADEHGVLRLYDYFYYKARCNDLRNLSGVPAEVGSFLQAMSVQLRP